MFPTNPAQAGHTDTKFVHRMITQWSLPPLPGGVATDKKSLLRRGPEGAPAGGVTSGRKDGNQTITSPCGNRSARFLWVWFVGQRQQPERGLVANNQLRASADR